MKNKKLERELFIINGMATVLLNQAKDIVMQFDKLKKYTIEDMAKSKDKLDEIIKKVDEAAEILTESRREKKDNENNRYRFKRKW